MVDDRTLNQWFCCEVLPLELALMQFIRRNHRDLDATVDIRQEVYARALAGARRELPANSKAYIFTITRNLLINAARRARIVSIEHVAELENLRLEPDVFATERHLIARDELHRAEHALSRLPPRCREIVRLRKVEGYSTREAADHMGVSVHTIEKQLTQGMCAIADFMLGGSGRIRRSTKSADRDAKSRSAERDAKSRTENNE